MRDFLLKYFAAKPGEKPLSEAEYEVIKPYIDRRQGGLNREAYTSFKEDKEMVKAASISQVHRDHRIMESRVDEVRPALLKALNAKPGEKPLTIEEFKDTAIFLDRKNGGLRHYAWGLFKDDKEILAAAEKHRQAWRTAATKNQTPSQEKPVLTSEKPKSNPEVAPQEKTTSAVALSHAQEKTPSPTLPKKQSKIRQFLAKHGHATSSPQNQGLEPGGD
ncbi:MAG: hypothetical protein PHV34_19170 [Verrucomicrobiae bacterium]|nr:hypothetical protein [Verrucomicrobiae bacterium]